MVKQIKALIGGIDMILKNFDKNKVTSVDEFLKKSRAKKKTAVTSGFKTGNAELLAKQMIDFTVKNLDSINLKPGSSFKKMVKDYQESEYASDKLKSHYNVGKTNFMKLLPDMVSKQLAERTKDMTRAQQNKAAYVTYWSMKITDDLTTRVKHAYDTNRALVKEDDFLHYMMPDLDDNKWMYYKKYGSLDFVGNNGTESIKHFMTKYWTLRPLTLRNLKSKYKISEVDKLKQFVEKYTGKDGEAHLTIESVGNYANLRYASIIKALKGSNYERALQAIQYISPGVLLKLWAGNANDFNVIFSYNPENKGAVAGSEEDFLDLIMPAVLTRLHQFSFKKNSPILNDKDMLFIDKFASIQAALNVSGSSSKKFESLDADTRHALNSIGVNRYNFNTVNDQVNKYYEQYGLYGFFSRDTYDSYQQDNDDVTMELSLAKTGMSWVYDMVDSHKMVKAPELEFGLQLGATFVDMKEMPSNLNQLFNPMALTTKVKINDAIGGHMNRAKVIDIE